MVTQFLDKIGEIMSGLTGLGPAEATILFGIGLALLPPLSRGVLDNRLESIIETLDYTRAILVGSTLLAYYYLFGTGLTEELILISGGIIVGTAVNDWLRKLTNFN